ncbi:MAG TPA: hypothetical protein VEH54_08550 [Steroidobacteraceae bacterium]|nr:hypothetical protein [Steroidobacteraceae bacterium]
MPRRSLAWVLSVLLVFVQQGALLHELGHLAKVSHTAGATLRADPSATDNVQCLTCEAYAQIVNPITAPVVDVPHSPATYLPTSDPHSAIFGAVAPTPRSRGPPQI